MNQTIRNPRFITPLFLTFGIIYRAILIYFNPQPYIADQTRYHDIAIGILRNGIFADSTRPYGYAMIVAIWYKLFGVGNFLAWKLIQVVLDALIALFVYWTAKDVFGKKLPAVIAFILYSCSPFVAAYAGVLLTEVSAVFCMALFLLLWQRFFQTKKILYLISGAFFMGYLPEMRPAYFFFMVGLFVVALFLLRKMGIKWHQWILVVVAFILPFSYAIAGNYLFFHRISPLAVDGGFSRQLVASEALEGRVPHPILRAGIFPEPIGQMEWDLRFPYNAEYRTNLAKVALKKGIDIAMKDPWHFLRVRLNKAWYVWEKHFLFVYSEEPRIVEVAVYTVNTLLLVFAVAGIIVFCTKPLQPHQRIFLLTCIALLLYTSAAHTISIAEERYSLPVYPILFIFAGYAIASLKDRIKRSINHE
ncbi:MAG: glycosyltransferase family 39 protein [Candidatus Gottesmanbacteria bacterium]|nr:glycosyltransferase family 39 protein [Candidatus Gottesmanbacteria bacterium]